VTLKLYWRERRLPVVLFLVAVGALALLAGCGGAAPSASWFGLSVSDDTAYLSAGANLFAVNLDGGAQLWAFPAGDDQQLGPFHATPLLKRDAIIVGGYTDGKVYAIRQEGGTEDWALETESGIVEGAASTASGFVVGNNAGEVFLVDGETQGISWIFKAGKPIWAIPLVDEVNGRVYVASMDHRLYALDLERGEQQWAFDAGGALVGAPALSDGVLYFGGLNSTFYAIEAETATELWRVETDGWVWGGPLVHDGTVYFGDLAGKLYALDAINGSERWVFQSENGVRVTPLLVDDLLYFGTREGEFYAVGVDNGVQQWMVTLEGPVFSQPVLGGDYLLVSPHNAKVQLVAIDPESGAERWTFPTRREE
jgi:outer membrane protein assembly factor BamB